MKEESLVYVRLGYEEAIQSKRDVLAAQMGLLRMIRIIRHYRALRLEELKIKINIYRKIKELVSNIKKIKTNFPAVKIPHIKKNEEEFEKKIKETKAKGYDDGLEDQLQEIQERLRSIGG